MTQPDQYFPDTAVNALSFSEYAMTPQEDWEDQIRGDTAGHFNIAEIAFQTILDWVEQIPLIGPAIVFAITGIEGGLDVLSDWAGDVGAFIGNIVNTIIDVINDVISPLFGGFNFGDLPTPGEVWETVFNSVVNLGSIPQNIVSGLQGALSALDQWITDLIIGIGNVLDDIPMVGRNLEQMLLRLTGVKTKAVTADARSTQIVEDVTAAWANDTPTGTPTPVFDTIVAIRESFINGYTVLTYTSNDTWTVPAGLTELWYIVIGGGGKGQNGAQIAGTEVAAGGAGGSSGGYKAQQIDPSTLTVGASVAVTVGAAATVAGNDGGTTSIGSVVSVKDKGLMPTPFGYATSESKPGRGGNGGSAKAGTGSFYEDGQPGEASADVGATAGAAGAGGISSGGNAGHGGNASLTALTKSGGGGGGGGGGRRGNGGIFGEVINAGDGGNGGYPGGGSGGGGGAATNLSGTTPNRGVSGTPGHGIAFIMYKAAA